MTTPPPDSVPLDVAGLAPETYAVSEDALRCLAIRSPLNRAIYAVVREYRLDNIRDEDGYPFPLVDLMSNEPPSDISTGEMEMVSLVDDIAEAVEKYVLQTKEPREVPNYWRDNEAPFLRQILSATASSHYRSPTECLTNIAALVRRRLAATTPEGTPS